MREARCSQYVDIGKPSDKADARPGHNPEGRGAEQRLPPLRAYVAGVRPAIAKRSLRGAYCCRSPLQYRHIAADDPPKSASHIASVAHVPIDEIGSQEVIEKPAQLYAGAAGIASGAQPLAGSCRNGRRLPDSPRHVQA